MLPKYSTQLQNPYYQPPYQRLQQMEAQQHYNPQYDMMPSSNPPSYLKGRPVVSMEEARAAQIDLDGSLFIFTDIGNNKIYTKQINLDGIAVLKTYSLVEDTPISNNEYVTKSELDKILASMKQDFSRIKEERNAEHYESINEQQLGTTKKTIREQPSF